MLKPIVPVLFLLLSVMWPAHGQAQEVSAGMRVGLSVAELESESVNYETRSGFSFGVFADYGFASWFSSQPELQFVMKGADTSNSEVDINYLELLVPVELRVALSLAVRPRLFAGLSVALELSCRTSFRAGGVVSQLGCADELPEDGGIAFVETRTFDFGALVGAGVDITVGPGFVMADVRYTRGLTNINSQGGDAADLKNRVVQFLVGYAILLAD
jgi:hypothetical protein